MPLGRDIAHHGPCQWFSRAVGRACPYYIDDAVASSRQHLRLATQLVAQRLRVGFPTADALEDGRLFLHQSAYEGGKGRPGIDRLIA